MRDVLLAAVAARGGIITREEALAVAPHYVLDKAVAAGLLVRLFPRVYVLPELHDDWATRCRAAVRSVGDTARLSHTTGLSHWALMLPEAGPIHVSVDAGGNRARSGDDLVVHRRRRV